MLDILNPFRKSLFAQIMAAFSLLSLVTVSLVSYSAYRRARATLEKTVYDQLTSSVSLKEYQLIEWIETQRREAMVLARSPLVIDAIDALNVSLEERSATINSPASRDIDEINRTAEQATTVKLQNYLKLVTGIQDNLYSIELLASDGTILLSNQSDRKGQVVSLANTTYFEADRTLEPKTPNAVVPNIYLKAGVPTITFATPVMDETGRSLDILLATTPKSETINQIIRQRAGLGDSGEAYLVKTMEGRNLFLAGTPTVTGFSAGETSSSTTSAPDLSTSESGTASSAETDLSSTAASAEAKLSSNGIDQSLQGEDGKGLYQNYENVPVVGVYRWLDQYDVALLAELSQAEAFQPAVGLARQLFVVGTVTAGILLLVVYALARRIIHPILVMSRAAHAMETSRFQPSMLQLVGDRPDELGQLARTFTRMAERVAARQTRLKAKIQQGNERISKLFEHHTSSGIKSNTKINAGKQQASELELAYYDALQRKAAWLRQQSVSSKAMTGKKGSTHRMG